jgi:hypothetical protein
MKLVQFENLNENNSPTVARSFTVTVNDGDVSSTLISGKLYVQAVNDAPVANAVVASATEDTPAVNFSLSGSDVDGTIASANITTLPTAAQGILYLADGTTPVTTAMNLTTAQMAGLVFKPTANYNGTVAIGYTVTDNQGGVSVPANATITITAVNDAPVATAVTASGNEDAGPITLSLAGTDVDGTIASAKVSALPAAAQGVLYLADGTTAVTTAMALTPTQMASLVFKPTLNYNGSVNIAYTVTDNLGLVSTSTNATVTVAAVNDAPTWSAAAPTITVSEQSTTTLNGRGLLISDVDAGTGPMTLTISSGTSTDALTVAAGTSGVTIVSGNGTSAVVLQGTLAQLDALLASTGAAGTITHAQTAFTPTLNEGVTSATINLLVNDQGNTGSGGALSASKDVTITITSVASTVPGDGAVNTLYGGGAPDLLIGGGGADTLYGGAGDDVLVGDGGYIRNGSFEYWTGGTASASGSGSGFTLVGASVMPGITFNNFAGVGANAYLGSWSAAGVPSSALEWVNGNAAIPYQAGLLVADVGVSATTVGGATFSKIWAGAGETYDLKFLLTDKDIGINTAGENWQVVWNGATIGTISSTPPPLPTKSEITPSQV